ncbi:endoplasmic reticulum metallopeptidase 1 isoform X1 [Drosophila grimshawi]|uniref:FXNA-like protease n=2 Tax=Drosophila grimshawi TaxID=7222 RepID=B4J736_DROGR|nr:endoplasmic reticulum metallopeptidase 1 isoform X1 [Drosophila grimshawi]EDW01024.1 GH21200 [Drosophila grimshawi]
MDANVNCRNINSSNKSNINDEMNSKYENMKIIYNRSKIGWYWAPLFVAFWFLLFYLAVVPSFHRMPPLKTLQDELDQPGQFIGERAEGTLLRLSKIGPKVVGSAANEQVAVQLLLSEISEIIDGARTDLFDIQKDVQIASGNYLLWSMVNVYQSVQNVIVRLSPINATTEASLLINSHFDSVPGSSGAGDSGLMCVIMLEVLRVITKYETPLQNTLIFLFNGAEENPLQGSHAFITQHPWAKNVRAVVNLDSAGSGGREILFQSGPDHPWLMKYYGQHITHPFASTIGEEMFQNGFIPSETDYRIFRDFGNIPGLDMAHTLNGYVYHTKYDRFNLIPRRTYQLTGDNLLGLIKGLGTAPELEDPAKYAEGHMIYFDVLGWFFIYYPENVGLIVNICVCVLALLTIVAYIWSMASSTGMFRRRIFAKFGILAALQLCGVCLSLGLVFCIALFLDAVGLSMSWFSHTWMVFGLYFCPMFFGLGILPAIYFSRTKEHGLPLGYGIQLLMHSHCLILTVITIVMISFNIRSAFILLICIGFYTISVLINMATCAHKTNFMWLIPHCILQLLPFMFYTYCCYAFYVVFVPMQGREGNTNPEILIGGFTALFCCLLSPFLIPLLCLFRKSKTIITLFGICTIIFIILAATPVAFPYVEKTAVQRFFAVHTTRTFRNGDAASTVNHTDAGYYVMPVDRHPKSLDNILFDGSNYSKADRSSCETEIMCGFPIYSSRWIKPAANSYWVPGPEPNKAYMPTLKILNKESTSMTNIIFTLEVSGPDHTSIFIEPLDDAKLVDWTFTKEPLEKSLPPPHYVYWSYALDPTPLRFNLEFERDSNNWSGATFKIAIMGHRIHDDMFIEEDFREFLAKFPPWTHVNAWIGSYNNWQL